MVGLLLGQPINPAPEEALQRSEHEARADGYRQAFAAVVEVTQRAAEEKQDPGGFPPAGPVGKFGGVFHGDLSGQFPACLNMFI